MRVVYTVAAVIVAWGFLSFIAAALFASIAKYLRKDTVRVSLNGKSWDDIPASDVRDGWLLDHTVIDPDPHSPLCAIRGRKNKCSCGSRRNSYMN